jgi:YjbE family integral membrane protein
MELGSLASLAQIIWLDVVLSGDNALVIGIAASTLVPELRRKAIIFGLALATTIRILFAGAATYLLGFPGLLFAGGIALLWVSWRLFADLYWHQAAPEAVKLEQGRAASAGESHSLYKALVSITIADISMSIDNVLAVAAIARENVSLLVFGLALSIALMGLGATLIVKILLKYRWISYVGVALLVYISAEMLLNGYPSLKEIAKLATPA